jgi:hypothetical protein
MSENDIPLPPASFEFLVLSFRMQAEMQLGLNPYGDEPVEPNLPFARHSIDMLAMIQEKTKGNLSLEEQRLVENSLTELRFRYMHAFEEQKKKAAEPPPAPADAPTPADPA